MKYIYIVNYSETDGIEDTFDYTVGHFDSLDLADRALENLWQEAISTESYYYRTLTLTKAPLNIANVGRELLASHQLSIIGSLEVADE